MYELGLEKHRWRHRQSSRPTSWSWIGDGHRSALSRGQRDRDLPRPLRLRVGADVDQSQMAKREAGTSLDRQSPAGCYGVGAMEATPYRERNLAGAVGACRIAVLLWNQLKLELADVHGIGALLRLGILDAFLKVLRDGLAIRDAWLNLFSSETITGVLCADEANPATHLPLLIAVSRGMPTVACHHGALDGRYRYRASHAGFLLVGGRSTRMGRDKALLPYRGVTLGEFVAGEIRMATGSVTLIGPPERYQHLGLPI